MIITDLFVSRICKINERYTDNPIRVIVVGLEVKKKLFALIEAKQIMTFDHRSKEMYFWGYHFEESCTIDADQWYIQAKDGTILDQGVIR